MHGPLCQLMLYSLCYFSAREARGITRYSIPGSLNSSSRAADQRGDCCGQLASINRLRDMNLVPGE